MKRSQVITYLSDHGEFPSSFIQRYRKAIVFYANLLNDEDQRVPVSLFARDLTSDFVAPEEGHNRGGTSLSIINKATKEFVVNVTDELVEGNTLVPKRDVSDGDPGLYTKFGISYKHILANPNGLSGYLISNNLLEETDVFNFVRPLGKKGRFLACKSAKVSFCYFLENFVENDVLPREIDEKDLLICTLRHLGYTAYFGVFTLYGAKAGFFDIQNRKRRGMSGTNVYPKDVLSVLSRTSLDEVLEFASNMNVSLFGTHYRRQVQPDAGKAYKERFIKILKRLINVRDLDA